MKSGIYAIINLVTGKAYVGQAFNFKKRWTNHEVELRLGRHTNQHFQAAWDLYTENAFIFIVLERCVPDKAFLEWREQYWIDKLKSADREFGYNKSPSSRSNLGYKHSDESKAKWKDQRAKFVGVPRSQEIKDKIRASTKGRKFSDESREKMRLAKLGRKHTEETKAKMRLKTYTDEAREKLSKSGKARWAKRDGNIGRKKKSD